MNEIIQKLQSIQDVITIITKLIVAGQNSEAQKLLPNLTQSLGQGILLMIVSDYIPNDLKQEERNYWIDQISRVNEAIEVNDGFRIIDVLYIETMNKLTDYITEIKQMVNNE